MGCTSSTEVVTNAHTGKQQQKHKLGGSYPGNRRTPQEQYQPNTSDFNKQGQATAHFVSYGGGNALVLQQNDGTAQPEMGAVPISSQSSPQKQFIQVTLPDGVYSGQAIHVQAPDGKLNEIIVPDGFGPGSTFTVEFADDPSMMQHDKFKGQQQQQQYTSSFSKQSYASPAAIATASDSNYPTADTNGVANRAEYDDGFASGFQNPNFVPGPVASSTPAYASASISNNNSYNNNSYPMATADAKPVY